MTDPTFNAKRLPEWLQKELPDPSAPATISYDKDTSTYVLVDDDGTSRSFDNLEKAYDAERSAVDVVISEDVPESDDYGFITVPTHDRHHSVRMLFSRSDDDRVLSLVQEYEAFLQVASEYRDDSENFAKAYSFVSAHPAFWTRGRGLGNERAFDWTTYDFNIPHFEVALHDNGSHSWFIESGAHVPPDYTEHYHDLRLDVYGETPEACVLELAKKLDKFFNDDGSEKENVEYEKSPLEIKLDEVMKQYEKEEESAEEESHE